jgi:hypothetical protein
MTTTIDQERPARDRLELVDRYVAVWNEPDPDRRRQAVATIWTEDAAHLLEPPREVREAAAALRTVAVFQARGHAELEARVGRAYEEFVANGELSFRPGDGGVRVADAVKFRWEMISVDGAVVAGGTELVLLAADGRIRLDYQFIDP